MSSYTSAIQFDGPYGRYHRAVFELEHPEYSRSSDIWVRKLVNMLEHRKQYTDRYRYQDEWPLFARLFDVFENDAVNSIRWMIEALLLTEADYAQLEQVLGNDARFNRVFLALYHELFYHIRPYQHNSAAMNRFVMLPIMQYNGAKLAIGHIWKLLAHAGGLNTLVRKGFGNEPFTAEDLDYMIHLGCMRNCTMMLNYTASGSAFLEDSPATTAMLEKITEFESSRNPNRQQNGFKEIEEKTETAYGTLLDGLVTLIKKPRQLSEALVSTNGSFMPELPEAVEKCTPTTYTINE